MLRYIFYTLLLLALSGCSLRKAEVDFNPDFKIEELRTFTVEYKNRDEFVDLNEERVYNALLREMSLKGYEKSQKEKSDFYFNFFVDSKEKVMSDLNFGFGIGTFSRRSVISLGTTRDLPYEETTLYIKAVDSKSKKVFWNAHIEIDSLESKSPQERMEYLSEIVEVMLKEFPKKAK